MPEEMSPKDVVLAWNDLYSKQDVDGAVKWFGPDFKRIGDMTNWEPMGVEGWAPMQKNFFAGFPDWTWEIKSIISEGNHVVVEFHERGTFTEPYPIHPEVTLEPDGKSYDDHSSIHFVVKHGLIDELRAYYTNNIHRIHRLTERVKEVGVAPEYLGAS